MNAYVERVRAFGDSMARTTWRIKDERFKELKIK